MDREDSTCTTIYSASSIELFLMGFEDQIPPVPTRAQELAYIERVEKSFQDQPLYRFYMNEPLRTRKMHLANQINSYRKEWLLNFSYAGLFLTVLFVSTLPLKQVRPYIVHLPQHEDRNAPFIHVSTDPRPL